MKERVLVDLDSILTDIYSVWYPRYNERFGDTLTVEKVKEWEVQKYAKAGAHVFDVLREPGFYRGLPPMPGALEVFEWLLRDPAFEVFIVSSSPASAPHSWGEKMEWVQENIPSFNLDRFVLTYSKFVVRGDVLFDDGPHNLQRYAEAWPRARLATIGYPYNEQVRQQLGGTVFNAGDYPRTVEAWQAFYRWLKEG